MAKKKIKKYQVAGSTIPYTPPSLVPNMDEYNAAIEQLLRNNGLVSNTKAKTEYEKAIEDLKQNSIIQNSGVFNTSLAPATAVISENHNVSGPLDFNPLLGDVINPFLDITRFAANSVNNIRQSNRNRRDLINSRFSQASYNRNSMGVNNIPVYFKKGGQTKYLNNTGYLDNASTRNNPFNIIPSNSITMNGVSQPLLAIPNSGVPTVLQPNSGNYSFPGAKYVAEIPLRRFQQGGQADQVEQIIQAYARIAGIAVEEIYKQLQQLDPQRQQEAIQEMVTAIQENSGQQSQGFQQGGQTNELDQIIQAYAQLAGITPEEVYSQLENLSEEERQEVIQQMINYVQQASQEGQQPEQGLEEIIQAYAQATGADSNAILAELESIPPEEREGVIQQMLEVVQGGEMQQAQRGGQMSRHNYESDEAYERAQRAASFTFKPLNRERRDFSVWDDRMKTPVATPRPSGNIPYHSSVSHYAGKGAPLTFEDNRSLNMYPYSPELRDDGTYGVFRTNPALINPLDFDNRAWMGHSGMSRINKSRGYARNAYEEYYGEEAKKQNGGVIVPSVTNKHFGNTELEQGEVFLDVQGQIQKVAESENRHEDGGSMQPFAFRVLEDTSDKRKDKASKLLKVTPDEAERIVGFRPKKSLTHSKLFEEAVDFWGKKLKKAQKKVEKNLEYVEKNFNPYSQNSLDENLKLLEKLPTEHDIFNAIYSEQESRKKAYGIADGGDRRRGGKVKLFQNAGSTDNELQPIERLNVIMPTDYPTYNTVGRYIPEADIPTAGEEVFNTETYFNSSTTGNNKFNEPLRWHDLAGPIMTILESQRAPVMTEQVSIPTLQIRELNPAPAINQNTADFNAVLNILPNSGVGYANAANLMANKYRANNEVLGNYANTNTQRKDAMDQQNAQTVAATEAQNMSLRDQAYLRQLQSIEAARQQKLTAFDSLYTRIAQNRKLNREGDLILALTPHFDQMANFTGKGFDITQGINDITQIARSHGADVHTVDNKDGTVTIQVKNNKGDVITSRKVSKDKLK